MTLSPEQELFVSHLRDVRSQQKPWMLRMWGNDINNGVSISLAVSARILGWPIELARAVCAELIVKKLLQGGEIHWRLSRKLLPKSARKNIPAWVRAEVLLVGLCSHCGGSELLQVDHIVPVVLGGSSDRDNLQPLCRTCNLKKGGRRIG